MRRLACVAALLALATASGGPARGDEARAEDKPVLKVDRNGGFVPPSDKLTHFTFTLNADGSWLIQPPTKAQPAKKGKLAEGEADKWLKELDDAGLAKAESKPGAGAADEPFMAITVKDGKRITLPLSDKIAAALDKKILELVKP